MNKSVPYEEMHYIPIGIIHSPFTEPKGTPIQPSAAMGIEGAIEIFPEFTEGLKDIDGFSFIILLYHFHLVHGWNPKVTPFMDTEPHGIFATRAPSRPNPIGLSIVRLMSVEGNVLKIHDVDIIDGTLLLDVKPYVPEFDVRETARTGWLEKNVHKLKDSRDDERFIR